MFVTENDLRRIINKEMSPEQAERRARTLEQAKGALPYGLIKVMRADVRGDHLGGARVVSSGWGSGQLGMASVSSMGSLRARRVKIARLPNWKQLKRRFL